MTRNDIDLGRAPVAGEAQGKSSAKIKPILIAALAACSAMALTGCEEQSYPTPSVEQAAPPPPPPPPAPLMGAPAQSPPYAPCASTPCGPTAQPTSAPRVIASTPVPNPPDVEPVHRRHHGRYWTPGQTHTVAHHHRAPQPYSDSRWHVVGPAGAKPTQQTAATSHVKAASAPTPPRPAPAPRSPAIAATAPAKAVAPTTVAKHASPPAAPAAVGAVTDNGNSATTGVDADRYNSLQSALSNLIGIDAALATPDHFQAGQTVDVSLTLPADFAQEARDEAAKVGLSDAAASVNIDVHLTGTGFTIAPDQPEAQPLLIGQPTVFHWRVTPTAAAAGAVRADLTADLLTVGHSLPLGSVQSQAAISKFQLSGRLIGVGLLILVLVVVAGWLFSRSGKGPAFRRRDI